MPRQITLTMHDILQAAMRLRQLTDEKPAPGVPAPPFNAVLKSGAMLRALMPYLQAYVKQEAALRNEYVLRDKETGQAVLVKDPNGNIQDGQFYQRDPVELTKRLNDLRQEEKAIELPDLSLDDVMDVSRGRMNVDAVSELLPIVFPQELSDAGQQRLQQYEQSVPPQASA